jgi:hypothetical protein
MSDGHAALGDMMRRMAELDGMAELTAAEAAPLVEAAIRRTAAAGTTPDGEPWAPKKKGGGRPMVNAAAHVTAKAIGNVVNIVLKGVDVFHQFDKRTPRHAIPEAGGGVPAVVRAAMHEGARRAFGKIMGTA